ncbi:MAG TPA: exodeoxyribonuclease V subunit gamma, partial [Acidimicrobiales bacterium]|nr:exodeoxyribonuclease V subunit gamma [Acidimicrobiales bacterium]
MTLRIHRAERADRLAEVLADLLAGAPPGGDPFTPEVVSVPTRGVERWLAQTLSGRLGVTPGRGDGVCANVEFPFPGVLVGRAVAAATGLDAATDPWAPERSVWPLLDVVERDLGEGWLGQLAAHIGPGDGEGRGDERRQRRLAAVRHVADLFDRYGVHRPAMLRRWVAGDDVDADGRPLPADVAWQAELWRRLRAALDLESPAERLARACGRLEDDPAATDLPGRLSLFGLTRLPASHLDVLHALGAGRDVHLFLLHPSPALWDRLAPSPAAAPAGGLPRRRSDPTATAARNPLLATWGRDAREMQLVLTGGPPPAADEHHEVAPAPATLLGLL